MPREHASSAAERFVQERLRCCYSVREAARLSTIAASTIHAYEKGKVEPQAGHQVRMLASLYRVSPLYLLTGEDI
jgi:transcriptional regulator with XRE-family HTH domain